MLTLVLAVFLILFGLVMFGREAKLRAGLPAAAADVRHFLQGQIRRRIRMAALVTVLGALMAVGGWVEPRDRPLIFLGAWIAAVLAAMWLLWLAALDFFAARLHWTEQLQRSLVDIAKARADLRIVERSQLVDVPPQGPQGN